MEFRRIPGLPPYVFTIIDGLKQEARQPGATSSTSASATPTCPRRRSPSRSSPRRPATPATTATPPAAGIPKLREAVATLYARRFGVTLDPETR